MYTTENEAPPDQNMNAYGGRRGTDALILNLSNRRRRVVNFLPQPFYPWERTLVPTEQKAMRVPQPVRLVLETTEISCPYQDMKYRPSRPQSSRYADHCYFNLFASLSHRDSEISKDDCKANFNGLH